MVNLKLLSLKDINFDSEISGAGLWKITVGEISGSYNADLTSVRSWYITGSAQADDIVTGSGGSWDKKSSDLAHLRTIDSNNNLVMIVSASAAPADMVFDLSYQVQHI